MVDFAELREISPRQAWAHEAHAFTPWLASNLDRLGRVLDLSLELEAAEAPVGRYSADILARDTRDGSAVLIENQLEVSDHTHLGQVLTYLSGLKAQVIVWVAPEFREEHLSALRWLNANTVDPYAFFAVKLRVVQIDKSPLAPLFEVLERPNNWNRRLQAVAREAQAVSPAGARRRAFWTRYVELFPASASDLMAGGGAARWKSIPGTDLIVSQWLASDGVGVFVRGGRGVDGPAVFDRLAALGDAIRSRLGVELSNRNWPLIQRLDADPSDEAGWDALARWLNDRATTYAETLSDLMVHADG